MSVAENTLFKKFKSPIAGIKNKIISENNFLAPENRCGIISILTAIKLFQHNIANKRHVSGRKNGLS